MAFLKTTPESLNLPATSISCAAPVVEKAGAELMVF